MRWGNCLFWALWMRIRLGGRIHVRRAPGGLLRFLWSTGDQYWAYLPKERKKGWRALIHKTLFQGQAVQCNPWGKPVREQCRVRTNTERVVTR